MNSEAHEQCAQWIRQKFEQYGYQVSMQKADLKGYDGTILKSTNIIAQSPLASRRGEGGEAPNNHRQCEDNPTTTQHYSRV
jgi:hypothetical protein